MVLLLVGYFPIIILDIYNYENINYIKYCFSIMVFYNIINCYRNKNR